ncbi:MAG: hypothetical protein IJV11_09175 [Muribaculaceae bacterium]|nr:hypothetical protein [Muribaculaceae bacterium]
MKTIVLLLASLMPFALFSQSKSSNADIKKPGSSNIVIAPESNVLTENTLNLEVHLIDKSKSNDQLYSIRLSGLRSRSNRRLLLVEAQPIFLTLSNGKVLEFNTVGAGFKKVNNTQSHGIDDDLVFKVSREQINEIIQGRIVNVRFALNGTRMVNYKVENNRFSEALSEQLEVLDGKKNPMSGDIDRYLVPLRVVTTEK